VPTVATTFNGGSGSGTNKLDYSALGSSFLVTVTLTSNTAGSAPLISSPFSNINSVAGSKDTANTLTGPNSTNAWTISGANAGKVNTFSYTGMPHLVGGIGNCVIPIGAYGTDYRLPRYIRAFHRQDSADFGFDSRPNDQAHHVLQVLERPHDRAGDGKLVGDHGEEVQGYIKPRRAADCHQRAAPGQRRQAVSPGTRPDAVNDCAHLPRDDRQG
jgi:hypothetical protein